MVLWMSVCKSRYILAIILAMAFMVRMVSLTSGQRTSNRPKKRQTRTNECLVFKTLGGWSLMKRHSIFLPPWGVFVRTIPGCMAFSAVI